MKSELPRSSGIYQIRCIPNGKIYIGSAVDLRARWVHHVRSLKQKNHRNSHLQNAWDKYGEESFEFTVLQLVDTKSLLKTEQEWIDKTLCTDRTIGFNIYETAGSPGEAHVQVWEGFIDPDGHEIIITNLFDYCRQHGLDYPSMHRLALGKSKLKSYKGWTHKNSPRKREYIKTYHGFIDPHGKPFGPIVNLAKFCRENELENSHMVAVSKGKLFSHRGWTYDNDRERFNQPKTYTGFIDPNQQNVVITNLNAYCREHNLDAVHMREVMAGRRKSHKGWTWRNNDE